MCETFNDRYVDEAVDTLDCILFVGDRLNDDKTERDKLRIMLKRWEKRLDLLDAPNLDESN